MRVEFRVRGDRGQGGRPDLRRLAAPTRAGGELSGRGGFPTSVKCFLMTHLEPSGRLLPSPPPPHEPKTSFLLSAEGGDRRLSGLPPSGGPSRLGPRRLSPPAPTCAPGPLGAKPPGPGAGLGGP